MASGLVLEGGGMRGVFTAGVLDFFLDNNIEFDNCYGVSAGSCQGCSYLSKQRGRGLRTIIDYIDDKRYCGMYSLVTTGNIFGVDFAYNQIPNVLDPVDNDTFLNGKTNFYAVATECESGEARYFKVEDLKKDIIYIRASSSLPLVSHRVKIGDKHYLDGGVADSIPIKQSERMGNDKNVVVLTRESGYKKEKSKHNTLMNIRYAKYPEFRKNAENRYLFYNETIDYINMQEKKGEVFVIRPPKSLGLGRLEKNRDKLKAGYELGYKTAQNSYSTMMKYLNK